VAIEAPLSGAEARVGRDIVDGARLALDRANAGSGARGVRFVTSLEDDRANPDRGVKLARTAVSEGVKAVIGPFDPPVTSAVTPVYEKAKVVELTLSPAESAKRASPFAVSLVPSDAQAATTEAQEIAEVLHAQRVGILYDASSTQTSAVATRVASLLEQSGVAVAVDQAVAASESPSQVFSGQVASGVDVWYIAMDGARTKLWSSAVPARSACLVDLVAGTGPYSSRCRAAGLPSVEQMPEGVSYSHAFTSRFSGAPGLWGALAYDSATLFAKAVSSLRSWDPTKVTLALESSNGVAGVSGEITMRPESGQRVDAPLVVLDLSSTGVSSLDPAWRAYSGYPAPQSSAPSG
jgi:branched-chain amino acid transport system substrate-binding protein